MNRITKILGITQTSTLKGNFVSKSQKLFAELGLVHLNDGIGTYMPMLVKSLRKLERIVHKLMKEISAVEIKLPVLIDSDLYKTSGRLDLPNLYKVDLKDNKSYILSPTCEETVTHLLQNYRLVHNFKIPISFYQISTKFRDEDRPRSGLLRTREFVMKDLYIFDSNEDTSEESYKKVINLYQHFFNLLGVPYFCVEGSTGEIGGLKSHEFHFPSNAGQDKIVLCHNCGHNENLNLTTSNDGSKCLKCQSSNITVTNGIEVGHAFKLGTTFTKPFNVTGRESKQILHMGSFGLGLSRILAASVEVLCKPDKIVWPLAIAPYLVCIVPPKAGSKEETAANDLTDVLYHNLNQSLDDDIIIDDRTSLTVGKRLDLLKKVGFPFIIVIGKGVLADPPAVEVIDSVTGSVNLIQIPDVTKFVLDKVLNISKDEDQKEKIIIPQKEIKTTQQYAK